MIIRCYGARGSIPVSGKEYIKYGGDTTCIEVRSKNDEIIVVDAGSGIRRLGNKLIEEQRFELTHIFTHSHWDHILGFPFFKPIYHEKANINLIGCPLAQGDIKKILAQAMNPPFFPLSFDMLKANIQYTPECMLSYRVGTIEIFPIKLSHPNLGSGYKFVEDGKTFVFLTDNELGYQHRGARSFEEYAEFSENADLLLHDAEYTPDQYELTRTWGHSTYIEALDLALAANVKRFGLIHHNQDRTDTEQDAIVRKCKDIIRSKGNTMECFALTQTFEFTL
ncbi:MBL fold metallo-hydrolase [Thermodesulfobacteriota bacterium]